MASADIEQLSPDSPLKPLYVIHGEEDLLRIEALDTLRAAAKRQGYLNREVYTADNAFDWNELLQSAGSAGLFADLKLLEIHIPGGKPGKTGGEALQSLAERLPEDTVTVVMLPLAASAPNHLACVWAFSSLGSMTTVTVSSGRFSARLSNASPPFFPGLPFGI